MCDIIEHGRGASKNISVEFERDASMRATEVIVIGRSPNGQEEEGVSFIISDRGKFLRVGKPTRMIERVDLVN